MGSTSTPPGRPGVDRRAFVRGGLGLAAAAALGSAALGGCSTKDPKTLPFWQFNGKAPQQEPYQKAQSQWYIDIVDAWNASHDTQVELVYVPNPIYINGVKLPTALVSGDGPDIFVVSPGDFLRYYNAGVLVDLTPYMDDGAVDDFLPGVLDTRTVGGRVHALPIEVEPLAMYYSVKALDKAGLSEADIPKTWDDLLDVGDKLRSKGQPGIVFDTEPGYYQNFLWYPFLWQAGGEVVDKNGDVKFASPAAEKALGLWRDMVQAGITPRVTPAETEAVPGFTQGLASMWWRGPWTITEMNTAAKDFEYGLFRSPVPDGGTYTTALGGWAFAANAKGRNPEAAARFCAWAIGSQRQQTIDWLTDWSIDAKNDIPPRKSALERADAADGYDSPQLTTLRNEVYTGGRGEPRYPPGVYKAVSDAIQACMLDDADPKAESERAAEKIEAYMLTYEGGEIL